MPVYTYETVPCEEGINTRRFEVFQSMSEDPLKVDPETGEPVIRVSTGGVGISFKGLNRSTVVNKRSPAATACGCASGRGHNHHHH